MAAPTISRSAIPFAHWSMRVGRAEPAFGEIVSQIADLEQGIANLVFTPKGSVPTQPEKGCDLLPFMDLPPAVAIPNLLRELWEGLTAWHPRIVVEEVQVEPVDDSEHGLSHFRVPVFWHPVAGVLQSPLRTDVDVTRDGLLLSAPSVSVASGSLTGTPAAAAA